MKREKVAFIPLSWVKKSAAAARYGEKLVCVSFRAVVTDPNRTLANRESARFVKAA